jgi:hypothetical protein
LSLLSPNTWLIIPFTLSGVHSRSFLVENDFDFYRGGTPLILFSKGARGSIGYAVTV